MIGETYIIAIVTSETTYVRLAKILGITINPDGSQDIRAHAYGSLYTTPVKGGFLNTDFCSMNCKLNIYVSAYSTLLKKRFRGSLPQIQGGDPDAFAVKSILKKFTKDHHRILYVSQDTFNTTKETLYAAS